MINDKLKFAWNDSEGERHIIGELKRENGKYYFKYDLSGIKEAAQYGFSPLICFPSVNATYENDRLFPVFQSRLPDKRRRDMDKILKTYGLTEYEPFELLKSSGGRLPTDRYEFVQ